MKHKFSSMGRVAIALVLALSLSLVMAVPVAADVSGIDVTPNPTTAEEVAEYTVVFTTTAYLMEGTTDKIYIEFPSGTDIAGYDGAVTINTVAAASFTVSNQILEITVPASGGDIEPGSVTVFLDDNTANDITNPEAGDYTLDVWTNEEPTHVESNPYTITPIVDTEPPNAVLVIAPNGGENWAAGSTKSITWSGGDDVIDSATTIKLEYSDDGGSSWSDITTLADTALAGYSWTVPSVDSTNCLVKVTATDDAANSVSDVSNAEFTIDSALPAVVVTAPNGGEVWVESSSHDITWTCTDTDLVTNPIDIDYSADGGTTWTRVASDEGNDGTYPWTIPGVYSTNCLVKVTATDDAANSGSDQSNAVFTIDDATLPSAVTLSAPNGGENWVAGSTQSISWSGGVDVIDSATTIKLEYSADAGSSWSDITTLADTADTSYSWVIPSIASANCLVKITATDDAANFVSDVSGAVFAIAAATEVWVDDGGNDFYPGTEALPFKTIAKGITVAGAGGTVNVLPGTYDLDTTPLTINKTGLTLKSTDGAADTIIDGSGITGGHAIDIPCSDVTFDGFTVAMGNASGTDCIWIWYGTERVKVQNNTITDTVTGFGAVILMYDDQAHTSIVADATVTNNVIEGDGTGIYLMGCAKNNMISYNTINGTAPAAIAFASGTVDDPTQGNTITGNIIIANSEEGIWLFKGEQVVNVGNGYEFDDNLIEENTISGNLESGIEIQAGITITNLTITGNTITDNEGVGIILIDTSVVWGVGNTIDNNNISGNLLKGIDNSCGEVVNAENNWWGDASGPYIAATNPSGTGDEVTANVDYRPWLDAPYPMPTDPITTTDLELVAGWNLISLPLIPTSSVITDVLAGLITAETVDWVDTFVYENGLLVEKKWDPPAILQNTLMSAGQGYWINMTAGDTLTISGLELPAPPDVPPTYQVYEGWNLIGVKSVNLIPVAQYLGGVVTATIEVIYSYDATNEVYELVLSSGNFVPGHGYWLAVSADGTIYP